MFRYLAILMDSSGRYRSGSFYEAVVFNAKNDKEAAEIAAAYREGRGQYALQFLGRITQGIRVRRVPLTNSYPDASRLSGDRMVEVDLEKLLGDETMLKQLQPFRPSVRKRPAAPKRTKGGSAGKQGASQKKTSRSVHQ